MKATLAWLINMETVAGDFYRTAAESFKNDEKISTFLDVLAKDEDYHRGLIEKAIECLAETEHHPPVHLDDETAAKLERIFTEGKERITKGFLTKNELFDFIIETEFSEWNPLFLYTVNSLGENVTECLDIASKVQMHQKFIRRFMEMTPDFQAHLEKFQGLPVVWRDKVLIVDDAPVILAVLRDLLKVEWSVETATNGSEALDKMRYSYFDVIITDIIMPDMNGITLYTESKKIWPDIGERFLFYSGYAQEYSAFFKENNLNYMMKPATLKDLKITVSDIAHKEVANRLAKIPEH